MPVKKKKSGLGAREELDLADVGADPPLKLCGAINQYHACSHMSAKHVRMHANVKVPA